VPEDVLVRLPLCEAVKLTDREDAPVVETESVGDTVLLPETKKLAEDVTLSVLVGRGVPECEAEVESVGDTEPVAQCDDEGERLDVTETVVQAVDEMDDVGELV
jgi:hypothetical protein